MSATPIFTGQNFFAPRFEITLRGQKLDQAVVRDVIEVSYNDSLDKLDSFEFTLRDWDPVRQAPKYSSPFDENGQPLTLENGTPAPSFDPGAMVELRMGYFGQEEPRLMMTGQVVSLSPSFPASGSPTVRVRALSLLYTLQKKHEVRSFENKTDSQIAQAIGNDLGIEVEIPAGQIAREPRHEYMLVNSEYPIIFLLGRARRLGYDLYVKLADDDSGSKLFFGRTPTSQTTYELEWGKSMIQFSPTLKIKGQVGKVVVRGWNPKARGQDRVITGEATWQDLDRELPDPQLLAAIDSALADTHEVVVDDPIESEEEAKAKAVAILNDLAKNLITGRGATVGLPDLRSGRIVVMKKLGTRYDGRYTITETTHSIGSGGYQTQFTARLEGPAS